MRVSEILKESDGTMSWGRVASSFTTASAIWAFCHVVIRSHAIPDASTLAGLISYAVGPYGANKFATAFGKKENL